MTLAIKLAIIAALILSIFIPFGYFLHGERTKKRLYNIHTKIQVMNIDDRISES